VDWLPAALACVAVLDRWERRVRRWYQAIITVAGAG